MSNDEGVNRRYHAPRRQAQAAATRAAILDAAHELFLTHGYAGTSVKAIAEAANVSDQTVYATFSDKANLLVAVGLRVVSGDLAGDAPGERDFAAELRAETDRDARIRLAAAWSRMVWEQGMLRFESMMLDAAATDARAARVAEEMWQRKYDENKPLFALVCPPDLLPGGDDFDEAYDLFLAIDSAAFVRILVEDRNWSWDTYERWLTKVLTRLWAEPGSG